MPSSPPSAHRIAPLLWLAVVVLITINLRPFLTAPGPLGHSIQQATGMDLRTFSWLTLLPMALMGVGGWLAPSLLQRWNTRTAVCGALVLIAVGNALRLASASSALLVATAGLCGLGVALVQSAMPGLIKRLSPHQVAPVMGLYSAALMGGGALSAQLSPAFMQWGMGWQAALAVWALPVLAALPLTWWVLGRVLHGGNDTAPAAAHAQAPARPGDTGWLLRRRRTWLLLISFGLMNGGYASTVAWLAPFYQTHGWTATQSGSLLAILSIAQAAAALAMPALARRQLDRRAWLLAALALQTIGFTGLALWPGAMPTTNAIVLGLGLGGCFALFMVVALDHLRQPMQAGALNALMQGGGFILAALAPLVMAQLQQASGSWVSGWLYQACMAVVVAVLVLRFAPQHYPQAMQTPEAQKSTR